jgi:hypothetical protein
MDGRHEVNDSLALDGTSAWEPRRFPVRDPGKSVRAWRYARDVVAALRDALTEQGFGDELPDIHPDVDEDACPLVVLGRRHAIRLVAPGRAALPTGRHLAELLAEALRELSERDPEIRGPDGARR